MTYIHTCGQSLSLTKSSFNMAAVKHEFNMGMTCDGCANAAKKVLAKIGETNVEANTDTKKVFVISEQSSDVLLEALKKTGKTVDYVGVVSS